MAVTMTNDNPFVKSAHAFCRESDGDHFVIGYMEITYGYRKDEDPTFIHDRSLGVKVNRLAGWESDRTRTVMYHAESPEQAQAILDRFLNGEGYSIGRPPCQFPVMFQQADEPLGELESVAEEAITLFRRRPAA